MEFKSIEYLIVDYANDMKYKREACDIISILYYIIL